MACSSHTTYPPATRGTIVLWGLLASSPFGGMTWQVLHHLAGIRRLGFDVWYVEDSDRPVYHPTTYWPTFECEANVAYLARQMHSLGLDDRWIFRAPGVSDRCCGARDLAGLHTPLPRSRCGLQSLWGPGTAPRAP